MAAFSLTSLSINVRRTKSTRIHSSLSQNDNISSSPPPSSSSSTPPVNNPQQTRPRPQPQKQRKPSLAQIERAIGAGEFRDRNTSKKRDSVAEKSLFDVVLSDSIDKEEGDLEKKLRETGEWLINRTEGASPSGTAGKSLVMVIFQLIIPIWFLAFLVASGTVKLPLSSPIFDDLSM